MASKLLAGLSAAMLACMATAALADVRLVQSTPAPDATVSAPHTIKLTFSEKVSNPGITLSMGDGMAVSTATSLSGDGKTLTVRPTSPFMAGKWTLSWHAASGGSQKSEGSYNFTIK